MINKRGMNRKTFDYKGAIKTGGAGETCQSQTNMWPTAALKTTAEQAGVRPES